MYKKSADFKQNKAYNFNNLNEKININEMDFKKVSLSEHESLQLKYDSISVLYAKEIEDITHFLNKINDLNFFSKENFSKLFEDFKEKFKKFNLNINFYQIKDVNEIIAKTFDFSCGVVLIDILNNKNDVCFISNFFDLQNIFAINFSNCNTLLLNKMSINVDFKKNILTFLSFEEKLKIILDCVYLNLHAKRALDLKYKI